MKAEIARLLGRRLQKPAVGDAHSTDSGAAGPRPRILCIVVQYPNFSETYTHEEIRSLRAHDDIKIVTYKAGSQPRRAPFSFDLVPYFGPCFVYGRIEDIDRELVRSESKEFLHKLGSVIEQFQPDVLHAHYLGMSLPLRKLAERYKLPFTIRTHSMDVLSEPAEKVAAMCEAANSPSCARVLAFPANRDRLIAGGLDAEKLLACWPVMNYARFHKPSRRAPTGRVMCAGPAIVKKAHNDFIDLAVKMRGSGLAFDLYAAGKYLPITESYNERAGRVINISYADPDDMPEVYPRYDWLVYPSDTDVNKVGLPVSIAEAQASGVGVCWQELPGRRREQLAFLDGGGFLFRSLDEIPEILARPYPEEMRLRGLQAAKRCDIEQHKVLLREVWDNHSGPRSSAA